MLAASKIPEGSRIDGDLPQTAMQKLDGTALAEVEARPRVREGSGRHSTHDRRGTVRGEVRQNGDRATFTADRVSVEFRKRGDRESFDLSCAAQ